MVWSMIEVIKNPPLIMVLGQGVKMEMYVVVTITRLCHCVLSQGEANISHVFKGGS